MLADYFAARRDIGFWKSIIDMMLEPQNPFEPAMRRNPRKGFVLLMVLMGFPFGAFIYFNLWS